MNLSEALKELKQRVTNYNNLIDEEVEKENIDIIKHNEKFRLLYDQLIILSNVIQALASVEERRGLMLPISKERIISKIIMNPPFSEIVDDDKKGLTCLDCHISCFEDDIYDSYIFLNNYKNHKKDCYYFMAHVLKE